MANTPRVLVVPHSQDFEDHVRKALAQAPVAVECRRFPLSRPRPMRSEPQPAVAIVDMRLPDLSACCAITQLRELWPTTPLVLTASPPLESATPHEPQEAELLGAVRTALLAPKLSPTDVLGAGPTMLELAEAFPRLAAVSSASVLFRGEPGVGKAMLAHQLHRAGQRREQPFVHVCCARVPIAYLERLLFGEETTNATVRPGLLEVTAGGVIYLHEAHCIGAATQGSLLRAVETGTFRCLGGTGSVRLKTCIVGSTTRPTRPVAAHDRAAFNLHAVVQLEVPSLRAHRHDIPNLVKQLASASLHHNDDPPLHFSPDALDALAAYPWPGNLGELFEVVERLVTHHHTSTVELDDLPPMVRYHRVDEGPDLGRAASAANATLTRPPSGTRQARRPRGQLLHFPSGPRDE